jgi:hypothetical protein
MVRWLVVPAFVLLVCLCLVPAPAKAGQCPAGASDCFLCGGVDGIPCTTNCAGVYDPNIGSGVSCRCPQGKPCECYCPYVQGTTLPTVVKTSEPVQPLIARFSHQQRDA